MRRVLLLATAALAATLLVSVPAGAFRLAAALEPVPGNPAERLAGRPADPERYDRARDCTRRSQPGTGRLVRWLERNAEGTSWGVYRCERWGEGKASLHAESRAIDWHLDARNPRERREGRRLVELLLAPDRKGIPRALARRMGIQEIIWDCSYWAAGMSEFARYRPCYSKDLQRRRKRVDPTVAHLDHLHIGLTRDGAAGRSSFWHKR